MGLVAIGWPIAQVLAAMGQPMATNPITLDVYRTRGVMLLQDIGPSILLTHGDGAAFAWAVAGDRPLLVKAIVAVEQSGQYLQSTARQRLTKLAGIPVAIVSAEASPSNAGDPAVATLLRDVGCRV